MDTHGEDRGEGRDRAGALTAGRMTELCDARGVDELLREEAALLFKHSPRCGLSVAALHEMRQFAGDPRAVPVYVVDVLSGCEVSRRLAERLGVPHASPQAILIRGGRAVWHASHYRVTVAAVLRALEASDGDA
jgi:bacillithiol system protein YtxJ